MATRTADFETDLIARGNYLNPGIWVPTGDKQNVFADDERPTGGLQRERSYWVSWVTERQMHTNDDLAERDVDVQILYRHEASERARREAKAIMIGWYEKLQRSGAFTGESGHAYHDVTCLDLPIRLESSYYALNVTLWHRAAPA